MIEIEYCKTCNINSITKKESRGSLFLLKTICGLAIS